MTRPLRILMATPRYFPETGGVETHVHEVARHMARRGAEVTILATDRSRRLPDGERSAGVTVLRVPAYPRGRDYHWAPGIYRAIAAGGWDVLHCQSYHTLVPPLAMLAALRAGLPYVVTFHGGGHSSALRNRARGAQLAVLRPLLARARRLVAVARFEIDHYGARLGLPASRFALIPNGAELPAAPASVVPPPADAPLVVSVGRLERYKGHHRVLEAMPDLLRERPGARLRIVGGGPEEANLRRRAGELGLADRVEIGGIPPQDRQAMAATLAGASVVALLSDFETHPIAALEALSLRRPVVVARSSGLGELADQGLALPVELPCPPEQVARAIAAQLDAPLAAEPPALPTWDGCADALLALYADVLGGRG
ncbi:MAG TPA: glycosyltransferase family 4 protein [Herpetosiphonaceae bacterium]